MPLYLGCRRPRGGAGEHIYRSRAAVIRRAWPLRFRAVRITSRSQRNVEGFAAGGRAAKCAARLLPRTRGTPAGHQRYPRGCGGVGWGGGAHWGMVPAAPPVCGRAGARSAGRPVPKRAVGWGCKQTGMRLGGRPGSSLGGRPGGCSACRPPCHMLVCSPGWPATRSVGRWAGRPLARVLGRPLGCSGAAPPCCLGARTHAHTQLAAHMRACSDLCQPG